MGIGNDTRGSHLSSAKVLETQLAAANEVIRRLTAVLAALLIDKHRGRALVESATVDVAYGDAEMENGFLVDVVTLKPLGQHRLQVLDPSGSLYVPVPLTIEPPLIEASAPCLSDWHKNGTGVRCPLCGSAERIV